MRFVDVKTEAQQSAACLHKLREMLVKQQTMWINHLRGLMAEFGIVVAAGPQHVGELLAVLADPEDQRLPAAAREVLIQAAEALRDTQRRVEAIEKRIVAWGRDSETCRHLITAPGYGPVSYTHLTLPTTERV